MKQNRHQFINTSKVEAIVVCSLALVLAMLVGGAITVAIYSI